jgi:hypothetical protein
MSPPALKRLAVVLGILCAVLVVGGGSLFWGSLVLNLQVAFADDQTQIVDEMRIQALQSASPRDITGFLEYAVRYYPSGTKQKAGSRLDRIVERHRAAVVREIVRHLRHTTGEDLGESPEPWIQKYAQR